MGSLLLLYLDPALAELLLPFLGLLAVSWLVYLVKLLRSAAYRPFGPPVDGRPAPSVSLILPVYNEDPAVWARVLDHLVVACRGLRHEIIVVPNGARAESNARYAEALGFFVRRLPEASKRRAIAVGAALARHDISVILDSDTLVPPDALHKVLWPFADPRIGGVTPRHVIRERTRGLRRMADWLEDNRFNEVVRGQSVGRAVACLPGRLYALRTALLQAAAPELVSQRFLGMLCISGDDRFLTSWLLAHGHQTVYQGASVVHTEAPESFAGMLRQRLRWSRGALRGTILALPWLWRYPYLCFCYGSTIGLRWALFALLAYTVLSVPQLTLADRGALVVGFEHPLLAAGAAVLLLFLAGLPKRLRHLATHPQDLAYYPVFFVLVTFVLTPLEWYGNVTCWKQGWLTRNRPAADPAPGPARGRSLTPPPPAGSAT